MTEDQITIETNYEGDWDEICSFCGKPQRDHITTKGPFVEGPYKGIKLIHRYPCPQEQHSISKKAVKNSIHLRSILWFYDVAKYLWGKIPFKAEIALIWKGSKHLFISARAQYYLFKNKPKK